MYQGRSQDLNRLLQYMAQHYYYDADVIIETSEKNMRSFKYCDILLSMVHTGGLCGVLRLTAHSF